MTSHRWRKFFTDSGLPSDVSDNYAIIFTENRIRFDMLDELNKDILYDMGIKKMGDVIAIMRHAKQVHSSTYRNKVFGSEETTSNIEPNTKTTTLKTVNKPDSTISNENIRNNNKLFSNNPFSSEVGQSTSSNRIVKIPVNMLKSENRNVQPVRIIRNVTGLNNSSMSNVRKRIQPPNSDDDDDNMEISYAKPKLLKTGLTSYPVPAIRNKVEAQSRLLNFSKEIEKAISSNAYGAVSIKTSSTPAVIKNINQTRLPVKSRLTTINNQNTSNIVKFNVGGLEARKPTPPIRPISSGQHAQLRKISIKDRLGKKSVFERLQQTTQQKTVFNRLG